MKLGSRSAATAFIIAGIVGLLGFAGFAPDGISDDSSTATIRSIPRSNPSAVNGLIWAFPKLEVHEEGRGASERRVICILKGKFNHPGWTLAVDGQQVLGMSWSNEWREFEFPVRLTGADTPVQVEAGGSLVTETETIQIDYPDYLPSYRARLTLPGKSAATGSQIPGLHVDSSAIQIRVENEDTVEQQTIAVLKGKFNHPEWSLLQNDQAVLESTPEDRWRDFEVPIELHAAHTDVVFKGVDPRGEVHSETVAVNYPEFEAVSAGASEIPSLGGSLSTSVGLTSLSYQETGLSQLSEILMVVKLGYQRPLSSRWDIGVVGFWDALPISTNQSGITAEFVGLNLRLGYNLPWITDPWSLSLATGGYYLTMITSGLSFGFRNMFGPQIFPVVRRRISARNSLGLYFKYSPVSATSGLGFASHELATGLAFTHSLPRKKTLSLTLDFAQDTINLNNGLFQSTARSVSLAASYGF